MIDAADLLRGKLGAGKEIPEKIADLIIVSETGWTLDYIDSLKEKEGRTYQFIRDFYLMYHNFAPRNQKVQV